MFAAVDGHMLEQNFLARMPRLSSFKFFIRSHLRDEHESTIETFQSIAWQRWAPIVYCGDPYTSEQTLFTLPYRSQEVDWSNVEIILSRRSILSFNARFSFWTCRIALSHLGLPVGCVCLVWTKFVTFHSMLLHHSLKPPANSSTRCLHGWNG